MDKCYKYKFQVFSFNDNHSYWEYTRFLDKHGVDGWEYSHKLNTKHHGEVCVIFRQEY